MEKNVVLAVILSLLVIFIWSVLFTPRFSPPLREREIVSQAERVGTVSFPSELKPKIEKKGEEITVNLGKKNLTFTTHGAAVKHWIVNEKNIQIDLVLETTENNLFFATLPELNYELLEKEGGKVTFQTVTPEGISVKKIYQFVDDPYSGYLDIELSNLRDEEKQIAFTFLTLGPGLGTDEKGKKENIRHLRALGYRNKLLEKLKFNSYADDWSWFGIDNHYFLAAIIPDAKIDSLTVGKINQQKIPLLKVEKNLTVPAKSKVNFCFRFYLGPKKYTDLKKYKFGLEETIGFGLFAPLSKGALYALNWFYKIIRNYGWAIVILTILLQILLFPLTKKSFQASLAMKKVQPLINELKLKYKNDPKRFQAELFHLYRAQKANPFGGCLPMILQIPVFWALFVTLQNAYELRGAGFILWIKDLSHPDTLFRIGNTPVNILPLLMGLLMLFQQKLTTVATDPTQKQMMYLMPIMFTFLFWNFPSGLVLYWFTSSLFSSLGQLYLLKASK